MKYKTALFLILSAHSLVLYGANYFDQETGSFMCFYTIDPKQDIEELKSVYSLIQNRPNDLNAMNVYKQDLAKNNTSKVTIASQIQTIANIDPHSAESILAHFVSIEDDRENYLRFCQMVGQGYLNKGKLDDAERVLEFSVQKQESSAAILTLTAVYIEKGLHKKAEECLKKVKKYKLTDHLEQAAKEREKEIEKIRNPN